MKKKLLFWITIDFKQFFVANYFQKFEDYELYAIVDCPSNAKNFFKNQQLVKFKKIWFLHEQIQNSTNFSIENLKNYENKYDLNLWELLTNERIFYKYNQFYNFEKNTLLSIDYQILEFFENILNSISPDVLLTKDPGFHHLEILVRMCKKRSIQVLMPFVPKLVNRVIITDDPTNFNPKINYNTCTTKTKNFSELEKYFENKNTTKNLQKFVKTFSSSTTNMKFKVLLKYLFSNSESQRELYTYYGRKKHKVVLSYILLLIKKKIRKNFIDKNLTMQPELNTPFVYFALGVDMERNLLIGSPLLNNQIEIIRTIVKSLPVNFSLYVKETPGQATREWRNIAEYKEIMNIPNVKLIHPQFSSKDLLKHSSLVMTIAGSSAFEATIYQKPSIVFSKTIYSILPSVTVATDLTKLRDTIKNSLLTKVEANDIGKYIDFIEKNSIEWPFDQFDVAVVNKFHFSGLLLDTEINEKSVEEFYTENFQLIKKLAEEFHNSIN
jgi:hypothetical protein|tara:strand:- start:36 stop:1523 length:1488 start_codon:yes stop_codon:yes gene_type:complete